jgi:hypothetical protein
MAIGHPCDGFTPCKRPNIMIPVSIEIEDNYHQ